MRSSGHNVTVLEGTGLLTGGHQSRNVGHIHEKEGTIIIGNLTETGIVPITGVGRSSGNNHGGLEKTGIPLQLIIVDNTRSLIDLVGQTLKVDGCGTDGLASSLLLAVGVKSVGQVTTAGKVQSHDAVVRPQQSSVDGKVGRRTGVRLHIDAPFLGIQSVSLQGTLLAKCLDLVDNLIASVVTCVGETLGVFVGEGRAEAVHDGPGGKVFGSDELKGGVLAELFLFDEVMEDWIVFREGHEAGEWLFWRLEKRWCMCGEMASRHHGLLEFEFVGERNMDSTAAGDLHHP